MSQPRPTPFAIAAPIVLAIAGIGLAFYGWTHPAAGPAAPLNGDLIYRSLRIIGPSDPYASVADDNWPLSAARWIGVIVAFWAVLSLFYAGLRTRWTRLRARTRRNHVVVIGDTSFADHLGLKGTQLGTDIVHLREGDDTFIDGGLIRLPYESGDRKALAGASAGQARRLVIAVDDDARAVDLALAAQRQLPHLNITARLKDMWLARGLHSLDGAERLRAFTDANAAAREILRRHPPFLEAQALGQDRVHTALIGNHDWIEALLVETILSARTLTFGKPAFSIFCLDTYGFHNRLLKRYPDLLNAAEVAFYEVYVDAHAPLTLVDPSELSRLGPITGVYCVLDDDAGSLSTAMALSEALKDDAAFKAPIFVRMSGQGMHRPAAGSKLAPCTFVPFGDLSDIARATGIVLADGEQAEKAWHKAYVSFAPKDKAAAVPWEQLSEEFRNSNQRAVGHMYAKLFDAGFDLRPWLARHDPWKELPTLALGEKLWRSDEEHRRLAELEHERWMADRQMSGWVGGEVRDNARKIHDNIVPFEALSDEVKGYDYQFVDLLDRVLKRTRDGLKRTS